jgi:hypothetical protein
MTMPATCAEAYTETPRSLVGWPWSAEALIRYARGEEATGVLVDELTGDEDGPWLDPSNPPGSPTNTP